MFFACLLMFENKSYTFGSKIIDCLYVLNRCDYKPNKKEPNDDIFSSLFLCVIYFNGSICFSICAIFFPNLPKLRYSEFPSLKKVGRFLNSDLYICFHFMQGCVLCVS